jgi:hypothetical protein
VRGGVGQREPANRDIPQAVRHKGRDKKIYGSNDEQKWFEGQRMVPAKSGHRDRERLRPEEKQWYARRTQAERAKCHGAENQNLSFKEQRWRDRNKVADGAAEELDDGVIAEWLQAEMRLGERRAFEIGDSVEPINDVARTKYAQAGEEIEWEVMRLCADKEHAMLSRIDGSMFGIPLNCIHLVEYQDREPQPLMGNQRHHLDRDPLPVTRQDRASLDGHCFRGKQYLNIHGPIHEQGAKYRGNGPGRPFIQRNIQGGGGNYHNRVQPSY